MPREQQLQEHVDMLRLAVPARGGMDILIIVTGNKQQEAFWQQRLTSATSRHHCHDAKVVVVHEDWPGGAGNGLGTLYAYQKARDKAKKLYKLDIAQEQERGAAVAMYHTAGKGTRLAPLPGSENNNKSAVKLPSLQDGSFITILEAVIRQTSLYAVGRRGRLSVFWGDQVFIPVNIPKPSTHHADILGCLGPLPTREEWEARGLSRYGLLAVAPNGSTRLMEKVAYDTVLELIENGTLSRETLFGTSLGSFSVSFELICALLDEFAAELHSRKGKLDSDPHLWMPLTLDERTYIQVMATKGMPEQTARHHYKRMQGLRRRVLRASEDDIFFGAVDVGQGSYWWDFGTVKAYYNNCLKLTQDNPEGRAIRSFFSGESTLTPPQLHSDEQSYLQGCRISSGRIRNSVLVGVEADHLDIADSVIINSSLKSVSGHGCLLYNVHETEPLQLSAGSVRADATLSPPYDHIAMHSSLSRDGATDWNQRVNGNVMSYAELYLHNEDRKESRIQNPESRIVS